MKRFYRIAFVMLIACCAGIAAAVAWSQEAPAMPKPGDEIKVKFRRGDETLEATVKLGERPVDAG